MSQRTLFIQTLQEEIFDVLVIGGGIHGACSAAALSSAGLRCGLVEAGDFASQTSQASSNMIWGGIKYLESLDFGLVRNLCLSRNDLMRQYPNQVKEIRFYAVCDKSSPRPAWQLRLGAWLYWLWGSGKTATPRSLRPKEIQMEEPLLKSKRWLGGVEYSDAILTETDARFTFGFIDRARKRGAAAVNYVRALSSNKVGANWETRVADQITGASWTIRSKAVVNATGPWAFDFAQAAGRPTRRKLAFSKGVHLIVPRLSGARRVLSFFSDDGRPFFVLPFGDKTCLGTTDTRLERPSRVVTDEDRAFILKNINERLNLPRPLVASDIISERCGVRPLVVENSKKTDGDWLALSRKHCVEMAEPGFVTILGGKLTDCLNIGREVLAALAPKRGPGVPSPQWYGEEPCPETFLKDAAGLGLLELAPDRIGSLAERLWRRYGSDAFQILDRMKSEVALRQEVIAGSGFYFSEVEHMAQREMIESLEDFLWRRSLLGATYGRERLLSEPGLRRACEMLFGARAEEKWASFRGPISEMRTSHPSQELFPQEAI